MNPLENLRGIHLPQEVSWWPLAWPWWALLIAMVSALFFFLIWRKRNQWRRLALTEMQRINTLEAQECIRACNRLLKQVAIQQYGQSCAPLHGQAWLEFLDDKLKQPVFLPELKDFSHALDEKHVQLDCEKLINACELWFRKAKC